MAHRTSAVADAFYKNAYSYIEWWFTPLGIFVSILLILAIIIGVRIHLKNVEEAKLRIEEAIKRAAKAAKAAKETQRVWDEKSPLQKGFTILQKGVAGTFTILDVLVGKKTS